MRFEDLVAWQRARQLTNAVYAICRQRPLASDFGLRDQLQRAAVSAMTNLAEGFERLNAREKIQFWNIARASAGEVRSLLYVVSDQGLSAPGAAEELQAAAECVGGLIRGLIRSYDHRSPPYP